ncbi:MAG TPA: hypothetical protein VK587_03405 [bacterium]|nr:hypothetical protein [bacterium]
MYDPEHPGQAGTPDKEGSPNTLTLDIDTSKVAQANIAHTALVEVERYAGPTPAPVTAYIPLAIKSS